MDSPNGVSDENKETRKETVINVNSMCSILSPGVFLLSNILQIRSGISQESFSFQIFHKIGVASLNKALGEVKKSVLKQNLGTQNAPRRDVLALASFSGGSFGAIPLQYGQRRLVRPARLRVAISGIYAACVW